MTNGKRKSSRLRDNFFIGQRFPERGAPGERREHELQCWQRGLFYAFNYAHINPYGTFELDMHKRMRVMAV